MGNEEFDKTLKKVSIERIPANILGKINQLLDVKYDALRRIGTGRWRRSYGSA